MTDKNLEELYKIPESKWAKIYCALNRWKFPNNLGNIKPIWWDEKPQNIHKMSDFVRPIMKEIQATIGKKACNREWNKDRMTDNEHNIFWQNRIIK